MSREALLAPQLRLFAVAVLAAFLAWVVVLIRTHRLNLRDSLLWFLSTLSALAVVIFPQVLVWIARALGIGLPSNALFVLGFAYVLLNLLASTIAISHGAARLRRLTQECALLRGEIEALRARVEGRSPSPEAPPGA
jgi:hypothetical protein